MAYGKNDVIDSATKLGRLINGGVVGYYFGGKTSEIMSETIPEQLISVVERHKKIMLGTSLAQSFVPGAGIAATAAAVASLWKMYYDINHVLGIKINENAGKSLTSAILTNLGSAAAQGVATTVSEAAKFIPVVGWVASAGITSVTSTAIVYGGACLYMNALSAMYNAKGNFDLDYLSSEISGNIEDYDDGKDDENDDFDAMHKIVIIIAYVLGVDSSKVMPKTNLEEDLGAEDFDKREIIAKLEHVFEVNTDKDPEDFIFVDDFIEEFTGESCWDLFDEDVEDTYDDEKPRFDSFFQSYINDEYKNYEIENLSDIFIREGDLCKSKDIASYYYCVSAVCRLEYFLDAWQNDKLRNLDQERIKKICISDAFDTIQKCRDTDEEDMEYYLISGTLFMLKQFWVDDVYEKDFYEDVHGDILSKCSSYDNGLFNRDWLLQLAEATYQNLIVYVNSDESATESITDKEEEYLVELKDVLADGEISSRERRLLEKIRTQLGISEARAAELEASLAAPSLSPEELEYFNEYKEIVAEGEISARDRRYLDKLKSVNGISDARAKEIEGLL